MSDLTGVQVYLVQVQDFNGTIHNKGIFDDALKSSEYESTQHLLYTPTMINPDWNPEYQAEVALKGWTIGTSIVEINNPDKIINPF